MIRTLTTTVLSLLIITGCNKLRIRDLPAEENAPAINAYHTSQINYQRNALSAEEIAPPLSQIWDESLNALPSKGFTIIDDWMFFGTINGYLGAANLSDGNQSGKKNLGDACPSPPTIWKNLIFQAFESGKYGIIAYDVNQGSVIWRLEDHNSTSSPIIINNKLYHQGMYGMMYSLNYLTGEMIWQKYLGEQTKNSLAYSDNLIIIAGMSGNVTAIDHETGGTVWLTQVESPVFADPVIYKQVIYIADYKGNLHALDLKTGKILRSKNFGVNLYHGPTIDNTSIYLGLSNGKLVELDLSSFKIRNSFIGEGPVSGPPLVTRSYIYYATLSRYLYILDKQDMVLLQDIEFDARLRSTPIIKNGKLVVTIENNRAIALARVE